jgi:hypothetical protein
MVVVNAFAEIQDSISAFLFQFLALLVGDSLSVVGKIGG